MSIYKCRGCGKPAAMWPNGVPSCGYCGVQPSKEPPPADDIDVRRLTARMLAAGWATGTRYELTGEGRRVAGDAA